ncbi:MAG: hypothetical protein GY939_18145 [Actinomycetia bacterium]|nr:hypothetical protein [Actinomycetes bacterium]
MSKAHFKGSKARYEFRVWGKRKDACRRLSTLADVELEEELHDCYLLVADRGCNAKIRRNQLKVKTLIGKRSGFERWSTMWHRLSDEVPQPFDQLMSELSNRSPRKRGHERTVARTIDKLDLDNDLRAVVVDKHRRRFQFGSIRAEATDLFVQGQPRRLRTLAIEGPDLDDLIRVRSLLGLAKVPNLALHLAVELQHGGE